jgi:hypothetical protein
VAERAIAHGLRFSADRAARLAPVRFWDALSHVRTDMVAPIFTTPRKRLAPNDIAFDEPGTKLPLSIVTLSPG